MRVPIIRTIVYWGLYWGPLILGNYQILSPQVAAQCPVEAEQSGSLVFQPQAVLLVSRSGESNRKWNMKWERGFYSVRLGNKYGVTYDFEVLIGPA